jgi:hypothetical protein
LRAIRLVLRGGDMTHRAQQWAHRMVARKVDQAARAIVEDGDVIRQHDIGEGFVLADFAGLQDFL